MFPLEEYQCLFTLCKSKSLFLVLNESSISNNLLERQILEYFNHSVVLFYYYTILIYKYTRLDLKSFL